MIKVVVKKPNELAVITSIKSKKSLDDIRALVAEDPAHPPWIEIAIKAHGMFEGLDLVCYCDEEGLLKKLPLNFYRPTDQAPIVGNVVAVKTNQNGDDVDMSEAEVKAVCIMLDTWSRYTIHLDKELN